MTKRIYHTNWSLARKTDIDKELYSVLDSAMQNSSATANKELFFQYVSLLFLAGKRRIEPFLYPVSISTHREGGEDYYKITSMVAKHYKDNTKKCCKCNAIIKGKNERKKHKENTGHDRYIMASSREMRGHYWRAENQYEKAFFRFLTKDRTNATIDFRPLLPRRYWNTDIDDLLKEYTKDNGNMFVGITSKFKIFKTEITDGKKVVEGSLVPHMCRHLRAYDLLVNHGYEPANVQRVLDWDNEHMPFYYSDIKDMVKAQEELEWLKRRPRAIKATQW